MKPLICMICGVDLDCELDSMMGDDVREMKRKRREREKRSRREQRRRSSR